MKHIEKQFAETFGIPFEIKFSQNINGKNIVFTPFENYDDSVRLNIILNNDASSIHNKSIKSIDTYITDNWARPDNLTGSNKIELFEIYNIENIIKSRFENVDSARGAISNANEKAVYVKFKDKSAKFFLCNYINGDWEFKESSNL